MDTMTVVEFRTRGIAQSKDVDAIVMPRKTRPARCHYCRKAPAQTKDHIVPKARGGHNREYNYVPACVACNQAKADTWPTCLCYNCVFSVALHELAGVTEQSSIEWQRQRQQERWERLRNG